MDLGAVDCNFTDPSVRQFTVSEAHLPNVWTVVGNGECDVVRNVLETCHSDNLESGAACRDGFYDRRWELQLT